MNGKENGTTGINKQTQNSCFCKSQIFSCSNLQVYSYNAEQDWYYTTYKRSRRSMVSKWIYFVFTNNQNLVKAVIFSQKYKITKGESFGGVIHVNLLGSQIWQFQPSGIMFIETLYK